MPLDSTDVVLPEPAGAICLNVRAEDGTRVIVAADTSREGIKLTVGDRTVQVTGVYQLFLAVQMAGRLLGNIS